MDWTYRIVDHGEHFALHEVCVDESGKPEGWVTRAIDFAVDRDCGPDGLIASLEEALAAAKSAPLLVLREGRLEPEAT